MSQPVDRTFKLKSGRIGSANIPHKGVAALHYYNCWYYPLVNLRSKHQAGFGITDTAPAAFYGDKIIALTRYDHLKEGSTKDLSLTQEPAH